MGTAAARERLLPVFEQIGVGTLEREQTRTLPHEQVTALRDAGFGRLRIPVEFGGDGLDWPSFAELLVELAALDSNLPQIFRGHIAYVEELIAAPASDGFSAIASFGFVCMTTSVLVGNYRGSRAAKRYLKPSIR